MGLVSFTGFCTNRCGAVLGKDQTEFPNILFVACVAEVDPGSVYFAGEGGLVSVAMANPIHGQSPLLGSVDGVPSLAGIDV
jgi:hypothetical protein